MKKLSYSKVRAELERIAETMPDHRQVVCAYAYDAESNVEWVPGDKRENDQLAHCVAGEVLTNLGVDVRFLNKDVGQLSDFAKQFYPDILAAQGFVLTEKARELLYKVQRVADSQDHTAEGDDPRFVPHVKWGEAIAEGFATRVIREYDK